MKSLVDQAQEDPEFRKLSHREQADALIALMQMEREAKVTEVRNYVEERLAKYVQQPATPTMLASLKQELATVLEEQGLECTLESISTGRLSVTITPTKTSTLPSPSSPAQKKRF